MKDQQLFDLCNQKIKEHEAAAEMYRCAIDTAPDEITKKKLEQAQKQELKLKADAERIRSKAI